MALLRSPDGSETLDVPDNMVQHYLDRGARYAPPPAEQPLEANPLLNPLEAAIGLPIARMGAGAIRGGLAARQAASAASKAATGGAAGGVGKRVAEVAGRGLARRVPVLGDILDARDLIRALRGTAAAGEAAGAGTAGRVASEGVGSAASRVAAEEGRIAVRGHTRGIPVPKPKPAAKESGAKILKLPRRPSRKPEIGTAESRIKGLSTRKQGASRPELERRAAAMERAKQGSASDVSGRGLPVQQRLEQAAQELAAAGLSPDEIVQTLATLTKYQ